MFTHTTAPLLADIIYMRDGSQIVGTVVGQDRHNIFIATPQGRRTISKRQIARLTYQPLEESRAEVRQAESAARRAEEEQRRRELIADIQAELDARRRGEAEFNIQVERRRAEEGGFFHNEIIQERERRRKVAFRRSLLFPGLGQHYKRHPYRAWFFNTTALLALGAVAYGVSAAPKALSAFDANTNLYFLAFYPRHNLLFALPTYNSAEALRSDYNLGRDIAVAGAATFGAIYLLSLIDARYTDPDLGPGWADLAAILPDPNVLAISLHEVQRTTAAADLAFERSMPLTYAQLELQTPLFFSLQWRGHLW